MADTMPQGVAPIAAVHDESRILAIIVYGLFLVGWPCLHLTTIAGLILAYIKRGDARGTMWESHFDNQIEIFWISLVVTIAIFPLYFFGVGFLVLGFVVLWFFYRSIKGLIRAIEHKPYY